MYHFNTFHSKEYDKNILKLNLIRTLTNFNPLLLLLKQIIFFHSTTLFHPFTFISKILCTKYPNNKHFNSTLIPEFSHLSTRE